MLLPKTFVRRNQHSQIDDMKHKSLHDACGKFFPVYGLSNFEIYPSYGGGYFKNVSPVMGPIS